MRRALILVGVAVAVVGIVVGVVGTDLEGTDRWWPVGWLAWAPVGALILWRRPGNGVGRALLAIGVSWGLSLIGLAILVNSSSERVKAWSELISDLLAVVPWLGIVWLLIVFPTGRLYGRLERLTAVGVIGFGACAVLSFTLNSAPMDTTGLTSPLAVRVLDPATSWFVSEAGFSIVPVLAIVAIVSLVMRWRSSEGVERHQFRWLLFGSAFYVVVLGVGQVASEDNPLVILWIAAGAAIPIAIGIAVLRYRLYEIDRIISRTVTYAIVVGLLVGVVFLVAAFVGTQFDGPLVVAATTLGVAALFNPLRRRVQQTVERRFNRSRYDSERVIDQFAQTLRDRVDPDSVIDGWVGVVSSTMHPATIGVWTKGSER